MNKIKINEAKNKMHTLDSIEVIEGASTSLIVKFIDN